MSRGYGSDSAARQKHFAARNRGADENIPEHNEGVVRKSAKMSCLRVKTGRPIGCLAL